MEDALFPGYNRFQRTAFAFLFSPFHFLGNSELGREKRGVLGQVGTFYIPVSTDDPAYSLAGYISRSQPRHHWQLSGLARF